MKIPTYLLPLIPGSSWKGYCDIERYSHLNLSGNEPGLGRKIMAHISGIFSEIVSIGITYAFLHDTDYFTRQGIENLFTSRNQLTTATLLGCVVLGKIPSVLGRIAKKTFERKFPAIETKTLEQVFD